MHKTLRRNARKNDRITPPLTRTRTGHSNPKRKTPITIKLQDMSKFQQIPSLSLRLTTCVLYLLSKFGLETRRYNNGKGKEQYTIRIPKRAVGKLQQLVKPFMPSMMAYRVGLPVLLNCLIAVADILIGTLLGDCCGELHTNGVTPCFHFKQSIIHADYIYFLYFTFLFWGYFYSTYSKTNW